MLKKAGPTLFLAGGYIRARIAGEEVSDIDLWGSDVQELGRLAELLAAQRSVRCMSTPNAHTIITPDRYPVQFITRWVFSTPELCCESFDFTIASAAIWYDTTQSGWCSYCHEDFYRDLASKSLTYMSPVRNEDAGGSLMRLQKFMHKGYSISPGNLAKVIARLAMGIRFIGKEARDEVWLSQLFLGLLRQVDPLVVVDGVELEDEVLSEEMGPADLSELVPDGVPELVFPTFLK